MNVFILLLVFIFMAGWYLMDSPSQNIEKHGIEYAAKKTEINSVLTCVAHIHAEAARLDDVLKLEEATNIYNDTPGAERYGVETVKLCSDARRITPSCIPSRPGQSITHYIISTAPAPGDMGKTLELLESEFLNSTGFGIVKVHDKKTRMIIGNGTMRDIPDHIAKEMELTDGRLVYISQHAVTGRAAQAAAERAITVNCPPGQIRIFRFSKWQCAAQNLARACTGATIWDPESERCVADHSRKPICSAGQTAVFIDDGWECVNPVMQTECPAGQMPHLNYENMKWTCVGNPAAVAQDSEGARAGRARFASGRGAIAGGATCSDCEDAIHDPDTDAVRCVPSPAKLSNKLCYRGNAGDCPGAFYFGFPDAEYFARVAPALGLSGMTFTEGRSKNRRFNCLSCVDGYIDASKSKPPFIAVCQ
ncbi:MAG: hypothetical protein FWG39_01850 [Alphaproteobacteria bacterium]|nr:hypothetical protein [Alphaproteobacteria bacterium]